MSEELKPCPFCGGADIKVYFYPHAQPVPDAFCQCQDCTVIGPDGDTEAEAIAAWNRRTRDAQPEPAAPTLTTCNCRWDGDTQVQQCTLHEVHVHAIQEWAERAKAAESKVAALTVVEPADWEGGEGWESLAWELCADENGEDACNELIWEGGATPEPWGERWLKYEDEAKRLIALVHKHAATPPRAPLTDEEVELLWRRAYADHCGTTMSFDWFEAGVRALEAAHGITADRRPRNE